MRSPAVEAVVPRGNGVAWQAVTLGRAFAAEWSKAISLRVLPITILGSIVAAALLGAVYVFGAVTDPMTGKVTATSLTPAELATAMLGAMTFLQLATIMIGIVAVIPDSASPVIRTTLLAVPRRTVLLSAKLLVATTFVMLGALASLLGLIGGASPIAAITLDSAPSFASFFGGETHWVIAGAWLYLALIGLLAVGVSLALRQLVPTLISLLSFVLVVSPLLTALPEIAKWMPDMAGSQLYLHDASADPPLGGVVLTLWALVALIVGGIAFVRRDA